MTIWLGLLFGFFGGAEAISSAGFPGLPAWTAAMLAAAGFGVLFYVAQRKVLGAASERVRLVAVIILGVLVVLLLPQHIISVVSPVIVFY